MTLAVGIDEIDGAQIPARVAHAQPRQMAVAARDLEPAAVETERAVAAALRAVDLRPEGPAQLLAARARAADVRAGQIALERRAAELAVHGAVVFQLDPGLRRRVQSLERQVGVALEHGQQPPLDLGPEHFLFRVLIGAVRQRGLVHDAERVRGPAGPRRRAWPRHCRSAARAAGRASEWPGPGRARGSRPSRPDTTGDDTPGASNRRARRAASAGPTRRSG